MPIEPLCSYVPVPVKLFILVIKENFEGYSEGKQNTDTDPVFWRIPEVTFKLHSQKLTIIMTKGQEC